LNADPSNKIAILLQEKNYPCNIFIRIIHFLIFLGNFVDGINKFLA
jgi:hypothetical protein